jgi:hypothetical protein
MISARQPCVCSAARGSAAHEAAAAGAMALQILRCRYCVAAVALQLLCRGATLRQMAEDRRTSALEAQRRMMQRVA